MPKADWGGGVTGGVQGATTGFTLGGPVGGAIGGLTGFVGGLFGKKKKKKRSTFDKNQQNIHDEQYAGLHGEGDFADLYNYDPEQANSVFDQTIANPAYRNYQEKLAPQITGQFRNNGLMNSSYAGDALARSARDIQENLNAQRSQYLYGEQKQARNAKREDLNNYQNRQTFAYDKNSDGGGFDIDKIINSIKPEHVDAVKKYLNIG